MDTSKKWYQSKAIWVGIFQTVSAVLLTLADLAAKGTITAVDIILFTSGVVNIILRIWFASDTTIERSVI
jgi:hypothetical protein